MPPKKKSVPPLMPLRHALVSPLLDPDVARVAQELLSRIAGKPEAFFGRVIRTAIDEMLDGARTGRVTYESLSPEEKKYIGTKLEFILRDELLLPKGQMLDLLVDGVEVDVKMSQKSAWMIPPDYTDTTRHPQPPVCLFVGTKEADSTLFNVGVGRATLITAGRNRDQKGSLIASHLDKVLGQEAVWLVRNGTMQPNYFSTLRPDALSRIMAAKKGQARVNQLLHETIGTVIPRDAVLTVATQKDGMRRLRVDRKRPTAAPYPVLSGASKADREAAHFLYGVASLRRDEVMPILAADLARLPPDILKKLID